MISADGTVKLLDFGLAMVRPEGPPGDPGATATASLLTRPAEVVGTAAYLSPEQIRGEPADERSDLFAHGVALYEMAAGTLSRK